MTFFHTFSFCSIFLSDFTNTSRLMRVQTVVAVCLLIDSDQFVCWFFLLWNLSVGCSAPFNLTQTCPSGFICYWSSTALILHQHICAKSKNDQFPWIILKLYNPKEKRHLKSFYGFVTYMCDMILMEECGSAGSLVIRHHTLFTVWLIFNLYPPTWTCYSSANTGTMETHSESTLTCYYWASDSYCTIQFFSGLLSGLEIHCCFFFLLFKIWNTCTKVITFSIKWHLQTSALCSNHWQ